MSDSCLDFAHQRTVTCKFQAYKLSPRLSCLLSGVVFITAAESPHPDVQLFFSMCTSVYELEGWEGEKQEKSLVERRSRGTGDAHPGFPASY